MLLWRLGKFWYDKVPKAIIFRALGQNFQLKILESKDAIKIKNVMESFDSRT